MCFLLFFLVACSMMIQLQCAGLDCHMHFVCLRSYGSSPKHQRAIMAASLPVEEPSDDEEDSGPGVWKEFEWKWWWLFNRTGDLLRAGRPGFYYFFTDLFPPEQRHVIRLFIGTHGSRRRVAEFWHRFDQLATQTQPVTRSVTWLLPDAPAERIWSRSNRSCLEERSVQVWRPAQ